MGVQKEDHRHLPDRLLVVREDVEQQSLHFFVVAQRERDFGGEDEDLQQLVHQRPHPALALAQAEIDFLQFSVKIEVLQDFDLLQILSFFCRCQFFREVRVLECVVEIAGRDFEQLVAGELGELEVGLEVELVLEQVAHQLHAVLLLRALFVAIAVNPVQNNELGFVEEAGRDSLQKSENGCDEIFLLESFFGEVRKNHP